MTGNDTLRDSAYAGARAHPDALIDELDATVLMLGRVMASRHTDPCAGTRLTMPQLIALRVLSELGPTRLGDLAQLMGVKAPAVSAMVDSLERGGLIQRTIGAEDRRVHLVSVTEEGSAALAAGEAERREHLRRYLSVLDEEDITTLTRTMRKLVDAMLADRV